jgi:hypothetical protein
VKEWGSVPPSRLLWSLQYTAYGALCEEAKMWRHGRKRGSRADRTLANFARVLLTATWITSALIFARSLPDLFRYVQKERM